MELIETKWFPGKQLIVTRLSGCIDTAGLEKWQDSLDTALRQLTDHAKFKILINIYGFEAVDLETHKQYRNIIPLTLAAYGWKVGYLNLFAEESTMICYTATSGIRCMAAAHCFHDASKAALYEASFGKANERFFSDPLEAQQWIERLDISSLD